ncbi:MAG: aldehyde dehydrogenase family protein [Anaerolineae bacterium]
MTNSHLISVQPLAGSPSFAAANGALSPDTRHAIDAALAQLQARKDAWVALDVATRIELLDDIRRDLQAVADDWVAACVQAKGIGPQQSFAHGEEWVFFAAVLRLARLLRQSLADIRRMGRPGLPAPMRTRPNGQVSAPVLPQTTLDRLMFPFTTAEVWLPPGQSPEAVTAAQAAFYRQPPSRGTVALVLGAGNVSSLVPGDVLHALFVKEQVVALKPNPVNDYLGPLLERAFRALVRRGFLRIIYGGVAEGDYLCHHPAVDALHLTGSDKTFEAILFGPGPEGQRRKAARQPRLSRPFTAELGNVSPIIVVPGPWTAGDIRRQAGRIATWLVLNAGFNCLTPRVIIQAANWPQREALNQAIAQALAQIGLRQAYYPGARQRHSQFVAANHTARQVGRPTNGQLPWTYIPGVNPADTANPCFTSEAFCGLMAETALPAASPADFVARAVAFANQHLWGTLTATLMLHPASAKTPEVSAAVERALADLRYGTVLINQYGGYGYFLMTTPWGGYPGQDIFDIQSGVGMVNNVLMFDRPQKAVVRSPFTLYPEPVRATARHFDRFGRKLAMLEQSPALWRVPGLLWELARG